jgi:ATP-binding cassette subfamily B protein
MTKGKSVDKKPQTTKKSRKKVVIRLWLYLYKHKYLLLLALVLTTIGNLLALVGPKLSGMAVDNIELGKGHVNFDGVFYYVYLMILFYVLSAVFTYVLSILMIHISRKVVFEMRQDVFSKLMKLPVGYFDKHQTGDILSKMSYDIDTINTSLSADLIQIFASIITLIGSFVMMVTISPYLVIVFFVTIPISLFLTKFITGRTRPLYRKRSLKIGKLNGFVEEMISGQKITRAYNREEKATEKFDEKNEEAVQAYYNSEYYAIAGPAVNFVNNLSLSLISVLGAIFYLKGMMSVGNISSFVLYSRKFSGPINEMANIIGEFQSTLAAAERVFNLMDEIEETEDVDNAVTLDNIDGNVELDNIEFGYLPDKKIIHNLSFNAKKGGLIAIVGPTGAGKTTLINLLMRFYDADKGTISVDGNDIVKATMSSLRKSYAMVLQDTWLFHGSIFENVSYGKKDATLDEVIEVCKAAKIHSYIKRLPKGYETIIREDGTNISKGQKQLLTIARAMLLDCKMLILDEATSNVDTRTEIRIQQAMRRLMQDKTCFIIAHRLSTIQNSDLILVVNNGNIVEQGNHEELMIKKGFYSKLYNSQFE